MTKSSFFASAAAASLFALSASGTAYAASWDIADSLTGGPTATAVASPWSMVYLTGTSCNSGAPTTLTNQYTGGSQVGGKHGGIAVNQPLAWKNFSSSTYAYGDGGSAPAGAFALHPGPNNECSVARFTVPANQPTGGSYTIAATFKGSYANGGASPGDGTMAMVLKNGSMLGAAVDTANPGGGGNNQTVSLSPGDTIDFAVHMKGFYQFDTTLVTAQITGPDAVPTSGGGGNDSVGGIPVLNCSNSPNNPPMVDLSTGQPGWMLTTPSGSAGIVPASNVSWSAVPGAQWVGPSTPAAVGTYIYKTRVKINSCPRGRPAQIAVTYRADNTGTLFVNGAQAQTQAGTPNYGFLPASQTTRTVILPVGASGIQTIELRVQNTSGPTGLSANIQVTR